MSERESDPLFHLTRLYPSAIPDILRLLAPHVSGPTKHAAGEIVVPGNAIKRSQWNSSSQWDSNDREILIVLGYSIESFFVRDGKTFVVETYERGDVIGFTHDGEEDPSYRAVSSVETLKVSRARLFQAMGRDDALHVRIFEGFASRHALAIRRMAGLALDDVPARVWAELQRCAVQPNPDKGERIVRLTQQELADRIGSCRETVSRAMNDLKRTGRIQQIRNRTYLIPAST